MKSPQLLLLVCLVGCAGLAFGQAAPAPSSGLVDESRDLTAFSAISLCAPVNVLITPNITMGYGAVLRAEAAVLQAITTTVANGVLNIAITGPVATEYPIELTVSLPAAALAKVSHFGLGASGDPDGDHLAREIRGSIPMIAHRIACSL